MFQKLHFFAFPSLRPIPTLLLTALFLFLFLGISSSHNKVYAEECITNINPNNVTADYSGGFTINTGCALSNQQYDIFAEPSNGGCSRPNANFDSPYCRTHQLETTSPANNSRSLNPSFDLRQLGFNPGTWTIWVCNANSYCDIEENKVGHITINADGKLPNI